MHPNHNARATMHGFAHHPHQYANFAGRLAGRLYRRVATDVSAEELTPGARVLDVGTGPGLLPLKLVTACPHLTIDAIDLAPEMIDQARHFAEMTQGAASLTFTVADVARLPFPDATFDLVVSSVSQHHWTDPAAGLREVSRVLKPGGQAWIYDFRWVLGRARTAASTFTAASALSVQSPLVGSPWFNPIGRLVIRADVQP